MNEPAMISFFCATGVILLVAGIATWRTHNRSRMHNKADGTAVENGGDPENSNEDRSIRAGETADGNGLAENQVRGWRWNTILDRVGRAQVPNSVEDQGEMRVSGKGGNVDEKADLTLVSVSIAAVEAETNRVSGVEKASRPTDVAPFENLGGYRYGDFAYGHDNMAPLPVPASVDDPNPYHHSQGIAEVEAVPACLYPPARVSNKSSMESGYGSPLTSYNGLPSMPQHRDDMAALPIPKDHPLYQHHPAAQCVATPRFPRQDEARERPALQYGRESLVPAPLNPRRGRHSPHVDQNHSKPSPPNLAQTAAIQLERPSSPRPWLTSSSRLASNEGPEARYSVFESPLKQHPPKLNSRVQDSGEMLEQTLTHVPGTVVGQTGANYDVRKEWPLTKQMTVPVQDCSTRTPNQPVSASEHRHHHPQKRHRNCSSCDDAWTTVPLTPASHSSSRPPRWSWSAEDFRVVGMKGDNVV